MTSRRSSKVELISYAVAAQNEIELLICDEVHHIWESSNSLYTLKEKWSYLQQIEEILRAAKVSVLFIDDARWVWLKRYRLDSLH